MEKFLEYNLCHLALKPNPMDVQAFKGFVPFIINWVQTKKSIEYYSISEELGFKGGYHLDILLFSKSEWKNVITKKGKQLNLSGELEKFMINMPNSTWGRFYCLKNESKKNTKEYNIRFLIGYNIKENYIDEKVLIDTAKKHNHKPLKNWNNLDITKDQIQECLEFYDINRDEKAEKENEQDTIPLHSKNCFHEMKKWLKKEPEQNLRTIISDSNKKGNYCWVGMSNPQIRKLMLQIKNYKDIISEQELYEMNDAVNKALPTTIEDRLHFARNTPDKLKRLDIMVDLGCLTRIEFEELTGINYTEYCQTHLQSF